jgi:hypothetical protein
LADNGRIDIDAPVNLSPVSDGVRGCYAITGRPFILSVSTKARFLPVYPPKNLVVFLTVNENEGKVIFRSGDQSPLGVTLKEKSYAIQSRHY